MNYKKFLFGILIVTVFFINVASAHKELLPRWDVKFVTLGTPQLMIPFHLSLKVKALVNSNTFIEVYLPVGINFVSGDTNWSGFLAEGDSMNLALLLSSEAPNRYKIYTKVYTTDKDTNHKYYGLEIKYLYILLSDSQGLWDTIPPP